MTRMSTDTKRFTKAKKVLKKTFGFDSFRPTQKKAIASVLSGKDTFVLMPTGGGKSLCYQIPALVFEGTTIVVSPLIALMKDQVDSLVANGVNARYLNSSMELAEQQEVLDDFKSGTLDLVYVSAERLVSPDFLRLLKQYPPSLFAIDEAHCISSWGHDFRPDYTKLSQLKTTFPTVPIIALTATADTVTRSDILSQLELRSPSEFTDSFDRPNISLSVLPAQKRMQKITSFLSDKEGQSGILYCLTRKQTEKIAKKLQQLGLSAVSYHAGLSSAERSRIQKSFVRDRTPIICATIAFGMGIDKSNVRWVIHYNMPKNIEGYYQELGRAGRDSAPAEALLFYTYADVEMIRKFFIDTTQGALQLGKLERMKEYSEGVICRRKMLLRYFDEEYDDDCGNCDVCENPYPTLDGTKVVHQTLKVVSSLQKKGHVSTKELIIVMLTKSDKVGYASWQFYIAQMKNLGYIQVDFSNDLALTITKKGRECLHQKEKVALVTLDAFIERQEQLGKSKGITPKKDIKEYYKNELFEKLRELRAELAASQGIAAYMVFSDATLLEMAHEKPSTKKEMLNVSGVGEVKWERYGEQFIAALATLSE